MKTNTKITETAKSAKTKVKDTTIKGVKEKNAPAKEVGLVVVKGLTDAGKLVKVPAGRAAVWQDFLAKDRSVKAPGQVSLKGVLYNKKPFYLPAARAKKWEASLEKYGQ